MARMLSRATLKTTSCGSPVPTGVSKANYVVGTRIPFRHDSFVTERELLTVR